MAYDNRTRIDCVAPTEIQCDTCHKTIRTDGKLSVIVRWNNQVVNRRTRTFVGGASVSDFSLYVEEGKVRATPIFQNNPDWDLAMPGNVRALHWTGCGVDNRDWVQVDGCFEMGKRR